MSDSVASVVGRLAYIMYLKSCYEIDIHDWCFNNYTLKHFFHIPEYRKKLKELGTCEISNNFKKM